MRAARYVAIALGCLLHGYTHFFASKSDLFIGLFFWALIPYAVAAILGCFRMFTPAALGYALGTLAGDIYAFPTADYGFLIMPIFNALVLGPIGAVLAWIGARLFGWRSRADAA